MSDKNRSIPEASLDTQLLHQRLQKLAEDEVVSYEELSSTIGRDVRLHAQHNLASARRMALHSERIVTEAVVNIGIKRMLDAVVVQSTGEGARRRITRISRKAIQKLTSVKFDALNNEQRIKHNSELSHLGALRTFSSERVASRVAAKVGAASECLTLSLSKTLEAFKGE